MSLRPRPPMKADQPIHRLSLISKLPWCCLNLLKTQRLPARLMRQAMSRSSASPDWVLNPENSRSAREVSSFGSIKIAPRIQRLAQDLTSCFAQAKKEPICLTKAARIATQTRSQVYNLD